MQISPLFHPPIALFHLPMAVRTATMAVFLPPMAVFQSPMAIFQPPMAVFHLPMTIFQSPISVFRSPIVIFTIPIALRQYAMADRLPPITPSFLKRSLPNKAVTGNWRLSRCWRLHSQARPKLSNLHRPYPCRRDGNKIRHGYKTLRHWPDSFPVFGCSLQ